MKRTRKILAGGLALALMATAAMPGAALAYTEQDAETAEVTSDAYHGVTSLTIQTDGTVVITDAVYDDLFGGDAAAAVAELVAAGAVTVNGEVVDGEFYVNGAKALWQNEDGTWSWKTHIMDHGENESYEEASLNCVVGLSKLRGPSYTLTLSDGQVTGIDFLIMDAVMAETVTIGDTCTTITVCGGSDGSMNRTDPSTIEFLNENVEADSEGTLPSDQCVVLYWEDEDGWHMRRADSRVISYTSDFEYVDTLLNQEYTQPWNRPTQPIKALGWLGIADEGIEMVQWFYNEDHTVGMSHVNAQAVLEEAIEIAEAALADESIEASEEDRAIFEGAVDSAKAVAEQDGLLSTEYEEAILLLAIAYGGDGTHYAVDGNVFEDGYGYINRALSETEAES